MKKFLNKVIKVSKKLDWNVDVNGQDITFQKYSPAGQDFNVTITATNLEEVVDKLNQQCDSFDCSYETYIWLDNQGHGKIGAPYDMKDLYEDMEACLDMMKDLYDELNKIED